MTVDHTSHQSKLVSHSIPRDECVAHFTAATGEVMRSGGVGRVIETAPGSDFAVGDYVNGLTGWQEYATVSNKDVTKINVSETVSPSHFLGQFCLSRFLSITDDSVIRCSRNASSHRLLWTARCRQK